jgi:hypothetical protein
MRYSSGADGEIKETPITEDDTPRSVLLRLKAGSNFSIADSDGRPFAMEDSLFGYCSFAVNPPVQLLHGSALATKKTSNPSQRKDNHIALQVNFKEGKAVFQREAQPKYAKAMADAISNFSIAGPCHSERVRAEDDRILVEIAEGEDAPWFTEKACPPMKLSDDKIFQESSGVGGWGVTPPPHLR